MRKTFCLALVALCGMGQAASAQSVPRIKAVVVEFDGNILTVMPDGEKQAMKIGVRPATRILKQEGKSLSDIHSGDFIGATVIKSARGVLNAQEVHIFPPVLKGSGEGLYPMAAGASILVLDGEVTNAAAASLDVKFRGASGDGPLCTGRAPANPVAGCQGSATLAVTGSVPVTALTVGDKSLLVPGTVLALSIMAGPDGKPVTPGLTVEGMAQPTAAPVRGTAPGARAK